MAYPFTLHFTRIFLTGTLAGLEHTDKLGVTSEADGHKAVEAYKANAERNGWTVKTYSVKAN
jgi:hypothetical protein